MFKNFAKTQQTTEMFFLKSTSRTVHHYHRDEEHREQNTTTAASTNDQETTPSCSTSTTLTVWLKSLLFHCSGFTVFGPDGNLAYRVDNYNRRSHHIVLMDGSGEPIFTICRRKKLGLVSNYWLVYEGEVEPVSCTNTVKKMPILWARKKFNIRSKAKLDVLAYVYSVTAATGNSLVPSLLRGMCGHRGYKYVVEGSYTHQSCKILDESKSVVAEVKKKKTLAGGASFGSDVFHLNVEPGVETNAAMAVVLILDRMFC